MGFSSRLVVRHCILLLVPGRLNGNTDCRTSARGSVAKKVRRSGGKLYACLSVAVILDEFRERRHETWLSKENLRNIVLYSTRASSHFKGSAGMRFDPLHYAVETTSALNLMW